MTDSATGQGTRDDPWQLQTASQTSSYEMYRDESADPPVLVCQVGKTQLRYDLRAIDDLHAMLLALGDWMPIGGTDETEAGTGRDRRGVGPRSRQSGGWLVRAEEGTAGSLRGLPAAAVGSPRTSRARARRSQQPGTRPPAINQLTTQPTIGVSGHAGTVHFVHVLSANSSSFLT